MKHSLGYNLLKTIYQTKLRGLLIKNVNSGNKQDNIKTISMFDMIFHYKEYSNLKRGKLNHGI